MSCYVMGALLASVIFLRRQAMSALDRLGGRLTWGRLPEYAPMLFTDSGEGSGWPARWSIELAVDRGVYEALGTFVSIGGQAG